MPNSAARLCGVRGCPYPAVYRGRCPTHRTEREADRNNRRSESRSVYLSAAWRKVRAQQLSEEPYCEGIDHGRACPYPATEVDHRIPIVEGGKPFDRENLQSLCKSHHSKKTAQENHFGGRQG